MATDLAYLNTIINDRRRETGTSSIDMTTVGFRAINSTLQIWNEMHDWPWTIKKVNFNYNANVDTYALNTIASDFKYPLTLKYYKPNNKVSEFWMVSPLRFDSAVLFTKRFAVDVASQVQTFRVKSVDGASMPLNTATIYNQNGTWVGASAISAVTTNSYEGYVFPSSVQFNFDGTSGTLTNDGNTYTTFTPIDLTQYQGRSNIYFDIFVPLTTNLTSFSLKWGTDASNYYSGTATTDYLGQAFATGWIRIKIPWTSPTTVGAPTITSIKYVQLTVTCSGATTLGTFYVQNFFVSENIPLTLTYYSTNMVATLAGAQSQIFSNSANTTDTPLWTGRWDMATEPFINSVLEIIFSITGEYTDMSIAKAKIAEIVAPLKIRYPGQRRYPTMQVVSDTNYQSGWDSSRRGKWGGPDN